MNSGILETLDTGVEFRKWISGNGLDAPYFFVMAKTPGGMIQSPPDFPLDGMRMEDKKKEIEKILGKETEHAEGLFFEVMFSSVDPYEEYEPAFRKRRIVEMHFSRRRCRLVPQLTPLGTRFHWITWGDASDKDEGDMSAKDALKVFSGVSKIASKYVDEHSPDGIILGTSAQAKESRSGIYRMIAERLASARNARTYMPMREPRPGLKNSILVWFADTGLPTGLRRPVN